MVSVEFRMLRSRVEYAIRDLCIDPSKIVVSSDPEGGFVFVNFVTDKARMGVVISLHGADCTTPGGEVFFAKLETSLSPSAYIIKALVHLGDYMERHGVPRIKRKPAERTPDCGGAKAIVFDAKDKPLVGVGLEIDDRVIVLTSAQALALSAELASQACDVERINTIRKAMNQNGT